MEDMPAHHARPTFELLQMPDFIARDLDMDNFFASSNTLVIQLKIIVLFSWPTVGYVHFVILYNYNYFNL